MLLGCCQDKYSVLGRLLQSLEEGVESLLREHMNLIDDKQRVFANLRHNAHLLDKRTNIVHRVVRCGIQLVNIQRATLVEGTARLALVASLGTYGVKTVYRLGKNAGTRSLTHSTGTAEEVGVRQLSTLNGVLQRRGDTLLTHHRGKCCGTVFSCRYNKLAHNSAKVVNFLASILRYSDKLYFYNGNLNTSLA